MEAEKGECSYTPLRENLGGELARINQNQSKATRTSQNALEPDSQPESTRTNQDQPKSNFGSASENAQNKYFERRAEAFWNEAWPAGLDAPWKLILLMFLYRSVLRRTQR